MNSRNGSAPRISADQVAAELVTASKNGTVRMLGVGPTLEKLAQLLVQQQGEIRKLEGEVRQLERSNMAGGGLL